jgi:hydrogenase nickel incorporation protein HypA/HybF
VVGKGTLAEGAVLEIVNVPAAFWCAQCQTEFECADYLASCPRCQELGAELRRGREIELSSLEIS